MHICEVEVEKKIVINDWTNEELSMYTINEDRIKYFEVKRKWKNEKKMKK